MASTTQDRRAWILSTARERGRVGVKELAALMDVSQATVRRDLKSLADERLLELVFGGALPATPSDFSFRSKETRNMEAKRVIGRLAARLIGDHDQVFLDSGTTCFQVAPHLGERRDLTVISNSVRLAMDLKWPGLKVVMLGGQYRPDRMDTVGPLAIAALGNLHGYTAFIGADGLSRECGLTASDIESAHLHARVLVQARETVLLADRSKFLCPSLCKITDWESVSRLVTDKTPSEDWLSFFEERNIEITCPDGAS